jgi:hypothetical protein
MGDDPDACPTTRRVCFAKDLGATRWMVLDGRAGDERARALMDVWRRDGRDWEMGQGEEVTRSSLVG